MNQNEEIIANDWLSLLVEVMAVSGQVIERCRYGAPWEHRKPPVGKGEMPYYVVLDGAAVVETDDGLSETIRAGDMICLPRGQKHTLHDRLSSANLSPITKKQGPFLSVSSNESDGAKTEIICGRFSVPVPHNSWVFECLPPMLILRANRLRPVDVHSVSTVNLLPLLVSMFEIEAWIQQPGGRVILNYLSVALFASMLRAASVSPPPGSGLLALSNHPRLRPALIRILTNPAVDWSISELAVICHMSRATFVRRFQYATGRSARELLLEVRISLAAEALRNSEESTESIAAQVGYQSVAAFRRAFSQRLGFSPGEWRKLQKQPSV